jgi:hypothetical protein
LNRGQCAVLLNEADHHLIARLDILELLSRGGKRDRLAALGIIDRDRQRSGIDRRNHAHVLEGPGIFTGERGTRTRQHQHDHEDPSEHVRDRPSHGCPSSIC